MKKLLLGSLILTFGFFLIACGNDDNGTEEPTAAENNNGGTPSADVFTPEVGEEFLMSGTIIIGEDLAAGVYDIARPETEDERFRSTVRIYENQEARDNDDFSFHVLGAEDLLGSYTLREGYILYFATHTLSFTRVR